MPPNAWIISAGTYVDIDLAALGINATPKRVLEYALSDIGRYLLCPGPFEVESRLMGCECDLKPTGWQRFRQSLAARSPFKRRSTNDQAAHLRQVFMAQLFVSIPALQDEALARHMESLRGMLQPHDPVLQEIGALNLDRVADIRGVCEDAGGHRTHINLKGDLETKRRYVLDNLMKRVPITLPQAWMAGGLYEMRGMATQPYQEDRRHRLLRFHVNGQFFACLLNSEAKVASWVEDIQRLHHLLLLQQAMENDPTLKTSIEDCLQGEGQALRLLVNTGMDIDYSRNRLPPVYQELFHTLDLKGAVQNDVIRSLNVNQTGVSFSFMRQEGYGEPRLTTSIAVLHDVKALEPVRETLPELYAAISRKASFSEAGKYYLLESIKGRPDEERL
jgi:hypothetical protein